MGYDGHGRIIGRICGNSHPAQPPTPQHYPNTSPSLGSLPELTRSACVPFCSGESSWRSQSLCIAAWPRRAALLPIAALRDPSWPGRAEPPPPTRDPLALVERIRTAAFRGQEVLVDGLRHILHYFPASKSNHSACEHARGVCVWGGGGGTCDPALFIPPHPSSKGPRLCNPAYPPPLHSHRPWMGGSRRRGHSRRPPAGPSPPPHAH